MHETFAPTLAAAQARIAVPVVDESAGNQRLAAETEIRVYFSDPHSPWQSGINENTNGLLRQYLPKGSDLNSFSQKELDAIAWKLNTRARKSLGFKCPAQLFTPDAFDFGSITLRFVLETALPILKPQLNAVLCR
jgi:hypothetical protein